MTVTLGLTVFIFVGAAYLFGYFRGSAFDRFLNYEIEKGKTVSIVIDGEGASYFKEDGRIKVSGIMIEKIENDTVV